MSISLLNQTRLFESFISSTTMFPWNISAPRYIWFTLKSFGSWSPPSVNKVFFNTSICFLILISSQEAVVKLSPSFVSISKRSIMLCFCWLRTSSRFSSLMKIWVYKFWRNASRAEVSWDLGMISKCLFLNTQLTQIRFSDFVLTNFRDSESLYSVFKELGSSKE